MFKVLSKEWQKSKLPILTASAVVGLGVGAAITHQWFMCPEYGYPKCYQQMVEQGFMPSERLSYEVTPTWREENFDIDLQSDVLCPFKAQVLLMVPEQTEDGVVHPVEKFSTEVTFENGRAIAKDLPLKSLSSDQDSALVVRMLPQEIATFDITNILGTQHTQAMAVIPLKRPE